MHKYSLALTFMIGLWALPFTSTAQRNEPILEIKYQYFSAADVADSPDFQGLSISDQGISLKGGYSFTLGTGTTLRPGVSYTLDQIGYDGWPESQDQQVRPDQLHAFGLQLMLEQRLGKGWNIYGKFHPLLSISNETGFDAEGIVYQGDVAIRKVIKQGRLHIGLGATYNAILGEAQFMPLIDFYWRSPLTELDIQFPYKAGGYFLIGEKMKLGAEAEVRGSRYYSPRPEMNRDALAFNLAYGGLAWIWKIKGGIALNLNAGLTINRTFEILDAEERIIADLDPGKFEPFYTSLGLSWNLPN